MEPRSDTNTLPLSIAQVDSTVYVDAALTPARATVAAVELSVVHEQLLASVLTRVGEVEAAEWALDQAKAACDIQISAALASGVPAETVAAAVGVSVSDLPVPGELSQNLSVGAAIPLP